MGAILLGSAGKDPKVVDQSYSIPIPSVLPVDPTVLIDTPPFISTGGSQSYIFENGLSELNGVVVLV